MDNPLLFISAITNFALGTKMTTILNDQLIKTQTSVVTI